MNTYIFWTAVGDEAESQQVAYQWQGTREEGERRLQKIGRHVTSWYVSNGERPPRVVELH